MQPYYFSIIFIAVVFGIAILQAIVRKRRAQEAARQAPIEQPQEVSLEHTAITVTTTQPTGSEDGPHPDGVALQQQYFPPPVSGPYNHQPSSALPNSEQTQYNPYQNSQQYLPPSHAQPSLQHEESQLNPSQHNPPQPQRNQKELTDAPPAYDSINSIV